MPGAGRKKKATTSTPPSPRTSRGEGKGEGQFPQGDRSHTARVGIVILAILLLLTMLFNLTAGASDASAWSVVSHWLSAQEIPQRDRIIVLDIRLPRILMGVLIGSALAVSGAVMQGLFRNPLADPGLVGVSSGASVGAIASIIFGGTVLAPAAAVLGIYTLPLMAFLASLVTTFLLYGIATRRGLTSVATMLLAGIALAALGVALSGALIYIADDRQLRDITFWQMGSLAGATWTKIAASGPIIALSLIAAPFLARGLNGLALGEASAHHLGIPVQRLKNVAIVTVAAAVGASVAVSGGIGFVGIIVPHLLRLVIGPDHRYLLPASALLGAILLLIADAVSRTIVAPAELPIGIVTALAGAPFFLWILLRRRGIVDL
ncbi:heme ABC transporter permease [Brucella endophytica]|uniref:Heme ABC transporter permease n=1 Tax=Brucella endophytica TaxID=1963359 RepID=A0A916WBW0_9HYPH|nr:iron ABC transporter permease [Brucella endophytica]GGA85151.1 heme ABC transporter permease [Brucella endophytica]